jgi:hypothetical protein
LFEWLKAPKNKKMKSRPFKSVKNKIKAIILKLDLLLKNSEKKKMPSQSKKLSLEKLYRTTRLLYLTMSRLHLMISFAMTFVFTIKQQKNLFTKYKKHSMKLSQS